MLQQVSSFKYLGCDISPHYLDHVNSKLTKFIKICGSVHKNETQMETRDVMVVPLVMYANKICALTRRDESNLMRYVF